MSQDVKEFLKDFQKGKVDSAGGFSLDPRKAREKMKKFQLSEPHRYVLSLAGAAFLLKASELDCYSDADDLILTAPAAYLSATEMEKIFPSLFGIAVQDAQRHRALNLLAIGLNAALGLQPQSIVLESWRENSGTRMLMTPDAESFEPMGPVEAEMPPQGIRIHVRERRSWRVFKRFFSKLISGTPEAQALAAGCRYAPVEVTLNRSPLRRPFEEGPILVWCRSHYQQEFVWEKPHRRGHLSKAPKGVTGVLVIPAWITDRSYLTLVWNGVVVAERHFPLDTANVSAILRCDDFKLNVSQSDVVEDEVYKEAFLWLRQQARAMTLRLAREFDKLDDEERPLAVRQLLHAVANKLQASDNYQRWQDYKTTLSRLPLFSDCRGRPLTLERLLEYWCQHKKVYFSRSQWDFEPWDETPVVRVGDQDDAGLLEVLEKVFGEALTSSAELKTASALAYKRENRWRAQEVTGPHVRDLKSVFVRPLTGKFEGELALARSTSTRATIDYFREGRFLLHLEEALLPTGFRVAIEHPDLRTNIEWTDITTREVRQELRQAIEQELPGFVEKMLNAEELSDDLRRRTLVEFLCWWLHNHMAEARLSAAQPKRLRPKLESFECFPLADGGFFSLQQIRTAIVKKNKLGWLLDSEHRQDVQLQYPVLLLREQQQKELSEFTCDYLVSARADQERELCRKRFLDKPQRRASLGPRVLFSRKLPAAEGEIGWMGFVGNAQLEVEVLVLGRSTDRFFLSCFYGPLLAVVNLDEKALKADYSGIDTETVEYAEFNAVMRVEAENYFSYLCGLYRDDPRANASIKELLLAVLGECISKHAEAVLSSQESWKRQLLEIKLWPLLSADKAEPKSSEQVLVSILDIHKMLQAGQTPGLVESHPQVPLAPEEKVLVAESKRWMLVTVFKNQLPRWDARFQERRRRLQELKTAQRVELTLPQQDYLFVHQFSSGGIDGVIGLLPRWEVNSSQTFLCNRRRLEELNMRHEPPVAAVLDHPGLRVDRVRGGVLPDENHQEALQILKRESMACLEQSLLQGGEAQLKARQTQLEWWCHLRREGRAGPVFEHLQNSPLLEDVMGSPVRPAQLGERKQLESVTPGFVVVEALADLITGDRLILRLTDRERASLRGLYQLIMLDNELGNELAARRNRDRPRLDNEQLELSGDDDIWLCRHKVSNRWYRGELGLPREAGPTKGVELVVEGLVLEVLDEADCFGFVGRLQGPFQPAPRWDKLTQPGLLKGKEMVDRYIKPALEELLADFPTPDCPGFEQARRAVLLWWQEHPQQGELEKQIEELRLLPLPEGRYGRLLDLLSEFITSSEVVYCRPGGAIWMPEGFVLELRAGSFVEDFVRELTDDALVSCYERQSREQQQARTQTSADKQVELGGLAEPKQAAKERNPAPESARPEATINEAMVAAVAQAAPATAAPRLDLDERLHREFRLLGMGDIDPAAASLLQRVKGAQLPPDVLFSSQGKDTLYNRNHPLVRRLQAQEYHPEHLYFLMSGLFSVMNRAVEEVDDQSERKFHARILSTLMGGGES